MVRTKLKKGGKLPTEKLAEDSVENFVEQQKHDDAPKRQRKRSPRPQTSDDTGTAKTKSRAKPKAKVVNAKPKAKKGEGKGKSGMIGPELEKKDEFESEFGVTPELDFPDLDFDLFSNLDPERSLSLGEGDADSKDHDEQAEDKTEIIAPDIEDNHQQSFPLLNIRLSEGQLTEGDKDANEDDEKDLLPSPASSTPLGEAAAQAETTPTQEDKSSQSIPPPYYKEKVFFRGDDYFIALLEDMERATRSIDLEAFIFELDSLGNGILQKLIEAAQRGVRVRVLVDGAGAPQWGGSLVKTLEKAGGKTRIFHPFPWNLWQWSRAKVRVPSVLKAIYLLLKINSRNHRKTCVIDGKIAYVGGFNIASNHVDNMAEIAEKLGKKAHDTTGERRGWRDSGVRLEGANLSALAVAFNTAWDHLTINERLRQISRHVYTNPIFRLNYSWHRRRVLYKNLLQRIENCRERVWVTNAYFVPDNFLLRKLQDAALRGVDVRILLPRESDVSFMPWASEAFYERLLKDGVRIFEYLPTILHSKTLILDDWMLIGSSNLNHRSLLHDLEIDVNLRLPESMEALVRQFLEDLRHSKEVTLGTRRKLTLYQRAVAWVSLYLKYWI